MDINTHQEFFVVEVLVADHKGWAQFEVYYEKQEAVDAKKSLTMPTFCKARVVRFIRDNTIEE